MIFGSSYPQLMHQEVTLPVSSKIWRPDPLTLLMPQNNAHKNSQVNKGQNLDISLTFLQFDLWTFGEGWNLLNGTRHKLDHRYSCVVPEGSHVLGLQVHSPHLVLPGRDDQSMMVRILLLFILLGDTSPTSHLVITPMSCPQCQQTASLSPASHHFLLL